MVSDAEKYKEEDEEQRQKIEAGNKLEGYIFQLKQAVSDYEDKPSSEDKAIGFVNKCSYFFKYFFLLT